MGPSLLPIIGTFLAVLLVIVVPYLVFVVRSEVVDQTLLRQRILTGGAVRARGRVALLKDVERLSVIGPLNRILGNEGPLATSLRNTIQLSGIKTTPGQIVMGSAALALCAYVGVVLWIHVLWVAGVAGLIGGVLPFGVLRVLRAKRLSKFEEQFPEAVDLIARTLRAGHAFTTGLQVAAEELPQPVAGEFRLLYDQQNFGLPITDALRALAMRIPLIDARFFVTAVLTQREAGGNLAEVLDNLSAVIRERFKIKRQLRVISAHGRLTGAVLASLPPALGTFMFIRMPDNFRVLTDSASGIHMIITAVGLQLLGAALIYKITKVEY